MTVSPKQNRAVVAEMLHEGTRRLVIAYPVPRPAILLELTPSELEVMDAWVSGVSMRAIATSRNSALRTVANQVASIYRKLGVGSRGELMARLRATPGEVPS